MLYDSNREGRREAGNVGRERLEERLRDRDARLQAEAADRNPVRELLGDPPPGRSALDRYQHVGEAENLRTESDPWSPRFCRP
jgi:hypothetical protein